MKYFLFLFLLPLNFIAQSWVQLPDFPGAKRDDGVAVVVGNKAYFGTGLIEWSLTIDFYAYDFTNNTWSAINNMPHTKERQYACAFPGAGCFFVFGGDGVGGALNTIFKYDIVSDSWTEKTPKPGKGLIGASCFNFGDKTIFAGGKYQDGKRSYEVWEYTISTDSWMQKNNFPYTPVFRASHCVMNGNGYMLGGIDSSDTYTNILYKYFPGADSWSPLINFPGAARAYSGMQAIHGRLFMFGGADKTNYYGDTWHFDESTISWFAGPTLPAVPRKGGMSCSDGSSFYYSCGISATGRLAETWRTDVPVGIPELDKTSRLIVFPNPAEQLVNIGYSTINQRGKVTIDLLNFNGARIRSFECRASDASIETDLSELPQGIYFLCVYEGKQLVETKKIFRK